ncbi:UNVERIFIED_CONTAM: hypothetical protein Sradi_0200400 [Sesamum radiatum]|uniref:Uncharacterized protein n=1 Tax=Sesamum radiatum TaxID=300843 RepID=A0AAW2W456_SESRA
MMLFGECGSDDNVEDEQEFFDLSGTCVDDGCVHEPSPSTDDCLEYESDSYMEASSEDDPSWWAFIQEYYASDTDTGSVNKEVGKVRRPPSLNATPSPIKPSSHNSNATPSSCASNDPDVVASSPPPLLDWCLIRRPPKKPKF